MHVISQLYDLEEKVRRISFIEEQARVDELANRVSPIINRLEAADASIGPDRDAIADCRFALQELSTEMERLQEEAAVLYRESIGSHKEEFEQMTERKQFRYRKTAAELKEDYHQLKDCLHLVTSIKSGLLDLEGLAERYLNEDKQIPYADEASITSPFAGESDRSSLSP